MVEDAVVENYSTFEIKFIPFYSFFFIFKKSIITPPLIPLIIITPPVGVNKLSFSTKCKKSY